MPCKAAFLFRVSLHSVVSQNISFLADGRRRGGGGGYSRRATKSPSRGAACARSWGRGFFFADKTQYSAEKVVRIYSLLRTDACPLPSPPFLSLPFVLSLCAGLGLG